MSKILSKSVLEDIRFKCDIADIIGSYFTLQKSGSSFKTNCPFHKEKTPSFHVNPQRQIYHCFGCGAGGDVFNFIMQHEKVDFMTAVKMMADRCGVVLELDEAEEGVSDKSALYELHSKVANLYHTALLERNTAIKARDYLEERGLTSETIEAFGIGYAPDRWDAVHTWARKNKYKDDIVEKAGLIIKRSGDSPGRDPGYYDRFRDRLMFPVYDEQSRVIGFSGRCLEDNDKSAKYINSPETPLFHKGRVLYALDKARRSIVDSREAIICEGQIDVIRCHQSGVTTAVAAQGTAFTEDHVRILRRYADSVVLVFDPDKAGQDAAIRAARTFIAAGLSVRVASLPKGEDPDSLIRNQGVEVFKKIVAAAGSIVSFQIEVLSSRENLESEVGVMRAAKLVLDSIIQSPNSVQKARLVQETAKLLRLPASALQDDMRHMEKSRDYRNRGAAEFDRKEAEWKKPDSRKPADEVALCELIVRIVDHPELGEIVGKYLPTDMLTDDHCRLIIDAALKSLKEGSDIQEILRDHKDPSGELQRYLASLLMAPIKVKGSDYSPEDAVKLLILSIWKKCLKVERDGLGDKDEEKRRELTYDLKSMTDWDTGSAIIEMELE